MLKKSKRQYTHRVAVNAYLIRDNKFLLLKRANDPQIWGPPGGRLKTDENPVEGLIREVKEETDLDSEVIVPVNTWFGIWRGTWLLSIDYLAYAKTENLRLSDEHQQYSWVTLEQLENGYPIQLHNHLGFGITDFKKAWQLHLMHTQTKV